MKEIVFDLKAAFKKRNIEITTEDLIKQTGLGKSTIYGLLKQRDLPSENSLTALINSISELTLQDLITEQDCFLCAGYAKYSKTKIWLPLRTETVLESGIERTRDQFSVFDTKAAFELGGYLSKTGQEVSIHEISEKSNLPEILTDIDKDDANYIFIGSPKLDNSNTILNQIGKKYFTKTKTSQKIPFRFVWQDEEINKTASKRFLSLSKKTAKYNPGIHRIEKGKPGSTLLAKSEHTFSGTGKSTGLILLKYLHGKYIVLLCGMSGTSSSAGARYLIDRKEKIVLDDKKSTWVAIVTCEYTRMYKKSDRRDGREINPDTIKILDKKPAINVHV